MRQRIIPLSHLVPSLSWWSVWTLPYYVWAGYAAFLESWIEERRQAARGSNG